MNPCAQALVQADQICVRGSNIVVLASRALYRQAMRWLLGGAALLLLSGLLISSVGSTRAGDCDKSYPTVCIPPPPPDLDCGEITHRRFKVLEPDPHGFDGDDDGIGCERD